MDRQVDVCVFRMFSSVDTTGGLYHVPYKVNKNIAGVEIWTDLGRYNQ